MDWARARRFFVFGGLLAAVGSDGMAQVAPASPSAALATRQVYLDSAGVIRWSDDRKEVTLFGANYVLPTASDYRAAGYLGRNRKQMIDDDMAHFARMGWDGMRLTFWGDWEASDSAGNLITNDHLDLQDYLIARARERGIYLLFSPIQLYGSNWPDALGDTTAPGFGRHFGKGRMGTDPAAIRAQVNYLRQILNHVNPYTGVALKDEPSILFIELANEPWHHPEDLSGSIAYLNALTDAVRSTGCSKLIFYNVSQDFRIGEAIRRSRVQGVTFGWYPTGLNSGHELRGNYLRGADAYPDMLRSELAGMPRIVYEFDSADQRTGTMYPAMARTFRMVGTQFAAMFAYDMLGTAARNLGWQTHYLNLVYTPRKAMSATIAAEVMHRLPRQQSYGPYPGNTRFGDFHISAEADLGELVAADAFLNAGATTSVPPSPRDLRRVAGYGSSPVVTYPGEGIYFLDKVRDGVWRLEVYPDAVPVRDPFEAPNKEKIVTRLIRRRWPMTVALPDLGAHFAVQPASGGSVVNAVDGRFEVTPGVYVLSASGPVDLGTLPARMGQVGFQEFRVPADEMLPLSVESLASPEYVLGQDMRIAARVVDVSEPDSVRLSLRPTAGGFTRSYAMRPTAPYRYEAVIPTKTSTSGLHAGPFEFVITTFRNGVATTFPDGVRGHPDDWDYMGRHAWPVTMVNPSTPLTLFAPGTDASLLTFTRIGDAGRRGLFRVELSAMTGLPVFHLELPVDEKGWSPPDYAASLIVMDRVRARAKAIDSLSVLRLRLRGLQSRQVLHVGLMEDDGTTWTTTLTVDSSWTERTVPISLLVAGRGVLLPQGFPGEWNYWVEPASGRGGPGDHPRLAHVERLQLSIRPDRTLGRRGPTGVEIESVSLRAR
ncbi:MAG: hypothetical protein U0132_05035 [Gemmatimonadaceae bacterium]